jgi:hypothetical protein
MLYTGIQPDLARPQPGSELRPRQAVALPGGRRRKHEQWWKLPTLGAETDRETAPVEKINSCPLRKSKAGEPGRKAETDQTGTEFNHNPKQQTKFEQDKREASDPTQIELKRGEQVTKIGFPLRTNKSITDLRRSPPSLPHLIGNEKCVLRSLLHY